MRAITVLHQKYLWMDTYKEIHDLIEAAGFTEVTTLSFKKIHETHYLPEQKIEELKRLVDQHRIDVIVFNEPLTVRQIQKLDELLGLSSIRLIDKVMLILEIFSRKANSKEIQLQIKLAEFKYVQPRMRQVVGESVNTEKQARDRGSGESLVNIMKSDFRAKISQMEKQLNEYRNEIQNDSNILTIPILGYYSVGKTTLFNILTDSNRETNPKAFTTMFLKSTWSKILGFPIEFIDTIGLVDLPPSIVDSFSMMLDRIFSSDIIIICIDGSLEPNAMNDQLIALDEYYQKFARMDLKYKILFVFTKCDKLTLETYEERQKMLLSVINKGMFYCYNFQIMGARNDKPKVVQQQFMQKFEELIQEDIFEFDMENLSPRELSRVHDVAYILNEEWKEKTANVKAKIPIHMFSELLGDLIDHLASQSKMEYNLRTVKTNSNLEIEYP